MRSTLRPPRTPSAMAGSTRFASGPAYFWFAFVSLVRILGNVVQKSPSFRVQKANYFWPHWAKNEWAQKADNRQKSVDFCTAPPPLPPALRDPPPGAASSLAAAS